MTNLNLDNANVHEIELTRQEVRDVLNGNSVEKLDSALDNAQGDAQYSSPQYIVIKIT